MTETTPETTAPDATTPETTPETPSAPAPEAPAPVETTPETPQTPQSVTAATTGEHAVEQSGVPANFTDLTIQAHRLEEQGVWSFGVTMAGAYIALGAVRLGIVDDRLREAADPGFLQRQREDAIRTGLVRLG